jgi:hypothetical protein
VWWWWCLVVAAGGGVWCVWCVVVNLSIDKEEEESKFTTLPFFFTSEMTNISLCKIGVRNIGSK